MNPCYRSDHQRAIFMHEFFAKHVGAVVLMLGVAALPQVVSAQYFDVIDLGSAGVNSQAFAINKTGEVAGWIDAGGSKHGARWQNDQLADIHNTVHVQLGHGFLPGLAGFNLNHTEIYDISDGRQMVGGGLKGIQCVPPITVFTALLLRPATNSDFGTPIPGDALTDLGTFGERWLGVANSSATAISNTNFVVGWSDIDRFTIHAFLVSPQDGVFYVDQNLPAEVNDLMHDLGNFGGQDGVSAASGVNDAGMVVGYSYIQVTPGQKAAYHCFLIIPNDTDGDGNPDTWGIAAPGNISVGRNTLMADLGTLGGLNSWGRDINNNSQVVGESDTTDRDSHAFLWKSGALTDLGTLGGKDSSASAVNDLGQVVGWAENAKGERRAYMWQNGVMTDLNSLIKAGSAIRLTEARDINEEGEIVGWGEVSNGAGAERHSFRLNPTSVDPNADVIVTAEPTVSDTGSGAVVLSSDLSLLPLVPESGATVASSTTSTEPNATNDSPPPLCGAGLLGMLPVALFGFLVTRLVTTNGRRRA